MGFACSSDVFFPFPDDVHRARKSGVRCLAAPSGSVIKKECVKVADGHGIVFVHVVKRRGMETRAVPISRGCG